MTRGPLTARDDLLAPDALLIFAAVHARRHSLPPL
jgi:hypothetical protein